MTSIHIFFIIFELTCLVTLWEIAEGYIDIIELERGISHAKV